MYTDTKSFQNHKVSNDTTPIADRLNGIDWSKTVDALMQRGFATLPVLLTEIECDEMARTFSNQTIFRSHIVMERYAFGRGDYKYFQYPLPGIVAELRNSIYPKLVNAANYWNKSITKPERYPETYQAFLDICHAGNQRRPTPLLLSYTAGGYCCLHQDLYGKHVFPFQVVFLLSEPGRDFDGGELLLTESDPKESGRAEVVPLLKGQAVIFAVDALPKLGAQGFRRTNLRHGVSKIRSGSRQTLGIIFHDAK